MISLIKKNKLLLFIYLVIYLACFYFIFLYSKSEIHIFLNQFHSPFFDNIFKYLTFIGDGIFIIIISVILLFIRFRYFLYSIISYLFSGLFVQIFKRLIFPNVERPIRFFNNVYDLYLVEGVKIHSSHSFPSGHTATAFAFFIIIAFITKNKLIKITCLFLAILVGYSRIYLSQHFLIDVWFGSFIGILSAFIVYKFISNINTKWIDLSVIEIFKLKNENK